MKKKNKKKQKKCYKICFRSYLKKKKNEYNTFFKNITHQCYNITFVIHPSWFKYFGNWKIYFKKVQQLSFILSENEKLQAQEHFNYICYDLPEFISKIKTSSMKIVISNINPKDICYTTNILFVLNV